jgi:hypothetical protein
VHTRAGGGGTLGARAGRGAVRWVECTTASA